MPNSCPAILAFSAWLCVIFLRVCLDSRRLCLSLCVCAVFIHTRSRDSLWICIYKATGIKKIRSSLKSIWLWLEYITGRAVTQTLKALIEGIWIYSFTSNAWRVLQSASEGNPVKRDCVKLSCDGKSLKGATYLASSSPGWRSFVQYSGPCR